MIAQEPCLLVAVGGAVHARRAVAVRLRHDSGRDVVEQQVVHQPPVLAAGAQHV